jgi:hypothetical protein
MLCFVVAMVAMTVSFSTDVALASGKTDFAGTWQGSLSNVPFEVRIWERYSQWNATISFYGQPENLEVLGWKENQEMFYFFRPADVACISMYIENGAMNLAYFERDNVRKVILTRVPGS